MSEERCIGCGEIIPDGRQFCPVCEWKAAAQKRKDEKRRKKSARDLKYNRENIIQKIVAFNRKNPEEMILYNYLIGKGNINGYIKQLIREDMAEQTARCWRAENIRTAELGVLQEIRARFVGRDGSCGFRNGRIYELWLSKKDGKYFISRRNFSATAIPYDTAEAVAKNWEIL